VASNSHSTPNESLNEWRSAIEELTPSGSPATSSEALEAPDTQRVIEAFKDMPGRELVEMIGHARRLEKRLRRVAHNIVGPYVGIEEHSERVANALTELDRLQQSAQSEMERTNTEMCVNGPLGGVTHITACDCPIAADKCRLGRKRTLLTTGFARCAIPSATAPTDPFSRVIDLIESINIDRYGKPLVAALHLCNDLAAELSARSSTAPLNENDEPLRKLCFDYRNSHTEHAEDYFQRIVRWVKQQAVRQSFDSANARMQEARDLLDDARYELRCASGAVHRAPITETRIKEVIEKISAFLAASDGNTKD
jgi:hypothetical protein